MQKTKLTLLLLVLFLFQLEAFSQIRINGKVVTHKGIPLYKAAVYINNTSIGTITNLEGDFSIALDEEGQYDLVVSSLGFETKSIHINTKLFSEPLLIKLNPKATLLEEVVISSKRKKISAKDRAKYLDSFKKYFIGQTKNAKFCKIKNTKALSFKFNERTQTLIAYASEPLRIINQSLGYKVTYDLTHFKLTPNKVTSLGYSRYEDLEGSDKKKKRWKRNRVVAYNGSLMHFVRALRSENLTKNGFRVSHISHKPNPKKPSSSAVKEAEAYLEKYQKDGNELGYVAEITSPKTKLDSAIYVIQKAVSESKYIEVIINRNIKHEDIIFKAADEVYLEFDNHLRVRYFNEEEDRRYARLLGRPYKKFQESTINLIAENVILDKSGTIIQPLDIVVQKYWSFLKFADKVPVDFSLDK